MSIDQELCKIYKRRAFWLCAVPVVLIVVVLGYRLWKAEPKVSFYACHIWSDDSVIHGPSLLVVRAGSTYLVNPLNSHPSTLELKLTTRDTSGKSILTKPIRFYESCLPQLPAFAKNNLVTLDGIASLCVESDDKKVTMLKHEMPVEKFEKLLKEGRL